MIVGFVGTAALLLFLSSVIYHYKGPATVMPELNQELMHRKPPRIVHERPARCYYIYRLTNRCKEY